MIEFKATKTDLVIPEIEFTKQEMADIAMEARTLIEKRTRSGKDIKDRSFAPYSKGNPKSGTVDLTESGKMLNDLNTSSSVNYGKIFMGTNEQEKKGLYHQNGTSPYTITPKNGKALKFKTSSGTKFAKSVEHPGLKQREWFGLSPKDIKTLFSKVIEPMFARKLK